MLQMFKKDFFKQQHPKQKQNMRTIFVLLPLFSW